VGEWFTTFDDAWSSFLARDEPLESFWDEFPDDPSFVLDAWLLVPPPEIKRSALRVQGALEEVRGLRVVPHWFLHVSLPESGLDDLLEHDPFEVHLPRLNCFHPAVVAEVESTALDAIDAPATFLPHLSLAYVELPIDPRPVREALMALRDTDLGTFVVDELVHVHVPAAKSTILEPWAVVERAALRR
jgi:hypothetical protein